MDYEKLLNQILAILVPNQLERKRVEKALWHHGTENSRVRLAILKLAGADLERIEQYVEQACVDYRDVLGMAEYPGQMRSHTLKKKDPERYAQVVEEDRKQYENWVQGILKEEDRREKGGG